MRFGAIGRAEWTYDTIQLLLSQGHELAFVITAKAAPEYRVSADDFERLAR